MVPGATFQKESIQGNFMKKVWTLAALIAVATIPLLLVSKAERKPEIPIAADANDIFEWDRITG